MVDILASENSKNKNIHKTTGALQDDNPQDGVDRVALFRWIVIIVILLSELFLYTWFRVNYTETGFRISREKEKQKVLKAYTDALSMESDRLLSPERIAYIATTRLNLIIPEPKQVIYMDM
ncbi:MAG: hypothetical protein HQK64_08515 [Desulfamplus sp.]|nr:hypothetical protein [Desulfamplus sp.]MBF0390054.1 hypothetical protein [Desulfamplus sp.]